jgi:hypothetical protein
MVIVMVIGTIILILNTISIDVAYKREWSLCNIIVLDRNTVSVLDIETHSYDALFGGVW